MLPHVAVTSQLGNETKKAFFLGYIVHRLLQCSLGRRTQDDRDHVANKRMDLAGPLMACALLPSVCSVCSFFVERDPPIPPQANMFRILFYQMNKSVKKHLQNCVDHGKDFNITTALQVPMQSQPPPPPPHATPWLENAP